MVLRGWDMWSQEAGESTTRASEGEAGLKAAGGGQADGLPVLVWAASTFA